MAFGHEHQASAEVWTTVTRGVYRPFSTKANRKRPIKVMLGESREGYLHFPMKHTACAVHEGRLCIGVGSTEVEAVYDLAIVIFGYEWDVPYEVLA